MRFLRIFTAAFFTTMGSAFAADLPSHRVPPVFVPPSLPAFTWTGFYLGAQIGYQWGHADAPFGNPNTGVFPFYQAPARQRGVVGGGHAGYQYQIQSIVLGIEGDVEGSDVRGDDGGSGGDVNGLNNNYQASIRGKIGYAFDRFLPYATGGAAFMSATATAPASEGFSSHIDFVGWTIGGGLAYAINDQWSIYAEYRYTDFEKGVARFAFYDERYDPKVNAVRVGFSYKFADPIGPVVARY